MREAIFEQARLYFRAQFAEKEFIPGKSYVPVTAKKLFEDDLVALLDASLDLWLTSGRFYEKFETEISKRFQRKTRSLFVNSGSSANLLAISALGSPLLKRHDLRPIQKGDEVITSAVAFPTTVNPIFQNGWTPVFVDADMKTLNPTLEMIQDAWTPKTRAVVLAHTLGNPYRSDLLAQWCQEKGLYLIEDCCDALGGTIGEKPVGAFGEFATLSFYPAHHVTTGEGGAVVPKGLKWRRIAENLRDWGRDCWCDTGKDNTCGKRFSWEFENLPPGYDHKYVYSTLGYNLKATDIQAAIGCTQLEKLDGFVEARRKNWETLYNGIHASPLLKEHLFPVTATEGTRPSWFGFPLHVGPSIDRRKLTVFLETHKVGNRLVFAGNYVKQPALQGADFRIHGDLVNADSVSRVTFWLGVHPGLNEPMLNYILEQLEAGIREQT